VADRKLQRSFRLADPPFDPNALARAAHAPDGSAIAVVTQWDVATGRELKQFPGLRGHATGLEFTPDGKRLVAASSDGALLVWDVPD